MTTMKTRLPPLPTIRDVVKVYQLRALKQLSQNFLMDMNLCRKIVREAGKLTNQYVCEVGPGPGGLTRAILERDVKKLVVIEKDRRFLPSLKALELAPPLENEEFIPLLPNSPDLFPPHFPEPIVVPDSPEPPQFVLGLGYAQFAADQDHDQEGPPSDDEESLASTVPLSDYLAEAAEDRLEIVQGDIMTADITGLFPKDIRRQWSDSPPDLTIIGNLPFNVSTPLAIRWLEAMSERVGPFWFGRTPLILTFQKEVAQRMVAPILGGQRCRLSAMCENWAHVEHLFNIKGAQFVPAPKVDVGVVRLTPLVEPRIKLPFKLVEKVCRHLFHYRQKYSIAAIKTLFPKDLEVELAEEIYRRCGINPKVTSIMISVEEIGDMCYVYDEICRRIPGLYHYYYREPKPLEKLAALPFPYPPDYPFKHESYDEQRL